MAARGTLRLVLGDQLSDSLSSLADLDPSQDLILMAEVMDEATYVRHHKQKLVLIFSAMRQFAERLSARGIKVRYIRLGESGSSPTLSGEVLRVLAEGRHQRLVITEPGEWRLARAFDALALAAPVPVEILPDTRFVCSRAAFEAWAAGRAELRMEHFYRVMRRRTGLLMSSGAPVEGRWNLDADNRKRLPKAVRPPVRRAPPPNAVTRGVMEEIEAHFPGNFGSLESFDYPTNADEAEAEFAHFLADILPGFGDFQDAMAAGEPLLWHARVSAAMNLGLIDPLDACRRAEAHYLAGAAPLNAVEGFIRQIIGWREFVRGVYWREGPGYRDLNVLAADRTLPDFYWTGDTDMACVKDTVLAARDHAYAHHIQRLMVTGNLALLLGVHPDEVNDWYMVVFADAHEWVELPNTHGMALFADGGRVGSKPYAASGAYIHRMSDYCGACAYDVKDRLGPMACPFNALYWDFLDRAEAVLGGNHRLAMPYKTLARMPEAERASIREKGGALRLALGARPRV